MRLGRALNRIAEIHPHFFNSFYRRVRVIREAPRPMPAAATVDITHRCSLRCPFCIAADVLDQREMSLAAFAQVAGHLKGIGRITLIGGEPFQHSEIEALAGLARRAAQEIEVFTNGLVLGSAPAQAGQRLRQRLPECSSDWLTLVLSVDPTHAGQMPEGRLAVAVEGLLNAEKEGGCRARFSVTHERLRTGAYIDTDVVRSTLAEVSPPLAELFMERLMEGRVHDTFYFNSVICSIPPSEAHRSDSPVAGRTTEFLRLEDLAFSPEVAISFDSQGTPVVYSSLASMWSSDPPGATRLGTLSEAGAHFMEWTLAGGVVPSGTGTAPGEEPPAAWRAAWDVAVALDDHEARSRLLRALPGCTAVFSWDGGRMLARKRAAALLATLGKGTGARVLRFGEEEGESRLDMLLFRELMSGLLIDDERREILVRDLARWLRRLLAACPDACCLPVYTGERELLGKRIPQHAGESAAMDRVHLPGETGFGPRDELVVRPLLELHPDGSLRLLFPGLSPLERPGPALPGTREPAVGRIAAMLEALCGAPVARAVLAEAGLADLVPDPAGVCEKMPLSLPGTDDLVAAFEECTFDRNRQRPDEENTELLALLLLHARERFPGPSVNSFATRALTWLERQERQGLSPTTLVLLREVKLRGRSGSRLARLLEKG